MATPPAFARHSSFQMKSGWIEEFARLTTFVILSTFDYYMPSVRGNDDSHESLARGEGVGLVQISSQ